MMHLFSKSATAFALALLFIGNFAAAQISTSDLDGRVNTVFTAIPFLRINPDGRTGGMGDVGIATAVDPAAMYHNVSKLAFAPARSSAGAGEDAGVTSLTSFAPRLMNMPSSVEGSRSIA